MITIDLTTIYAGSITQLVVKSPTGRHWIENNCELPDHAWNGRVLCVESRYAPAIIDGAQADGLIVE